MEKIKIGISRCLLGDNVRYDGGNKHDHFITETLGQFFEWVPVCPEVEYGLPIPREAMRLVDKPEGPRLMTVKTGIDHTKGMMKWAEKRVKELEKERLCGFIFKSKSPSSGMKGVKVYTASGKHTNKKGVGIFAGVFMKHFPLIPVEDEDRLHDPLLRENFIERIFVFKRWRDSVEREKTIEKLIEFHTDHRLLVMSHSPKHARVLDKIVAAIKKVKNQYIHNTLKYFLRGYPLLPP